eukprot:scaffold402555_cov26-Prasinocladus_malaysianus.AAC.1
MHNIHDSHIDNTSEGASTQIICAENKQILLLKEGQHVYLSQQCSAFSLHRIATGVAAHSASAVSSASSI